MVGGTHIYQSLPLPAVHTSMTITVKQGETRLITEDTATPVPEVQPSERSPTHTAASPVIQKSGSQNSVYSAPNCQPPPKSADHIHAQTRNRDETICPDHSDQLSSRAVIRLARPPRLTDVTDQCLGCVAKFCWCILTTHLTFLPLLDVNIPQPAILHYAPVFAVANFAAWCPKGMIENAKWFSKKRTQCWTVNLLGKLHPKWQQLEDFIPVSPDAVLSGLTGIHHSINWLDNGL